MSSFFESDTTFQILNRKYAVYVVLRYVLLLLALIMLFCESDIEVRLLCSLK